MEHLVIVSEEKYIATLLKYRNRKSCRVIMGDKTIHFVTVKNKVVAAKIIKDGITSYYSPNTLSDSAT